MKTEITRKISRIHQSRYILRVHRPPKRILLGKKGKIEIGMIEGTE